ncbi:MAG: ribonuclease H-like domain-containing protein [Chloroflexi bacterium]|nr:ribonuclease H-like domain-containing protein [Chloroflexota bacterium]
MTFEAYLDIETTGLAPGGDRITVIGIYLCNGAESRLVQLVGDDVTVERLMETLRGVHTVYTYNGRRFDLPFINACLGINLEDKCHGWHHHDLMYDCWDRNLKGGFKAVEAQLCITRETTDITGWDAVRLWWRYKRHRDQDALNTLLKYNGEDVMNLKVLREKLQMTKRKFRRNPDWRNPRWNR